MPLAPLRDDSTRPPERGVRCRLQARISRARARAQASQSRTPVIGTARFGPPSGGRTQALRRGTRGMDAERAAKGQGRPFAACPRSNAEEREVWARSGQTRMQGWPSLWLLSLGQTRESDAPCKAQSVVPAGESAAPGPEGRTQYVAHSRPRSLLRACGAFTARRGAAPAKQSPAPSHDNRTQTAARSRPSPLPPQRASRKACARPKKNPSECA